MEPFKFEISEQDVVCSLQRRTPREVVELIWMLGVEKAHAVARDILQGMPYEEAVMLLGTLSHHQGAHQLQLPPAVHTPRARTVHHHMHGVKVPRQHVGVRKHIHY